jgi:hypothetical protein
MCAPCDSNAPLGRDPGPNCLEHEGDSGHPIEAAVQCSCRVSCQEGTCRVSCQEGTCRVSQEGTCCVSQEGTCKCLCGRESLCGTYKCLCGRESLCGTCKCLCGRESLCGTYKCLCGRESLCGTCCESLSGTCEGLRGTCGESLSGTCEGLSGTCGASLSGTCEWQRRALGHLLRVVFEAHDFLGATCKEDARGFITEERKRMLVKVNDALIPWYATLSRVIKHTVLERLESFWGFDRDGRMRRDPTSDRREGVVVYVRVALQTGAFYVGETGCWQQRIKQHYMASHRHSDRCSSRCRGCHEHRKYVLHRAAAPHAWVTLSLAVCESKYEAKRLERQLILQWQPRLNQCERAPWLMKNQTYATSRKQPEGITTSRRKHTPPWRRNQDDSESVAHSETGSNTSTARSDMSQDQSKMSMCTVYTSSSGSHFDLCNILRESLGETVSIAVTPGLRDVTTWSWVKQKYGSSPMTVRNEDGLHRTTLKEWRPQTKEAVVTVNVVEDFVNTQPEEDLDEIDVLTDTLRQGSDDCLESYWRARHSLDRDSRIRVRTMIWDECERRFEGFSRRPVEVRLPFFHEVNAHCVRKLIHDRLDAIERWPRFLREWHKSNVRIITESPKSIEDILCNANKPRQHEHTCTCTRVREQLREANKHSELPMVDGHIFCIGRDFPRGSVGNVLSISASNIPRQTQWDLERAWQSVRSQLPKALQPEATEWKHSLRVIQTAPIQKAGHGFPTTRDVYTLRKALNGLVIGPLDKNQGELWACCPVLYQQALNKLYSDGAGYERLHVAALTPYRRRRYKGEELERQICRTEPVTRGNKGDAKDLVNLWKGIYRQRGWSRYAPFDTKGGFNVPYALFKALPRVR